MRLAALLLCTLTLLVLASSARGGAPPFDRIAGSFRAQLHKQTKLERQVARLKHKLALEHKANRYHARRVRELWRRLRARVAIEGPAVGFTCIHPKEGAWNDPNAPYWGGLQMDRDFMRTYGLPLYIRLGTADHWPPAAQIAVATVAYYSGRGFYPWPNTARRCGLL